MISVFGPVLPVKYSMWEEEKMKKKLVSALVIACMAAMSVGSVSAMADTVKIGVYEPASGDNGAGGKQETFPEG